MFVTQSVSTIVSMTSSGASFFLRCAVSSFLQASGSPKKVPTALKQSTRPVGFALLVAVRRRAPEPARRAREVALGRIDERLADAVKGARSLLLRLEEALWSGVGGDGVRGLVVLADVVRKADEAHGRVVALFLRSGAARRPPRR